MKNLYKTLSVGLIACLLIFSMPEGVFAANSHSGSFVQASTQYSKIENNLGWTGGNATICLWVNPDTLPNPAGDNQRGWLQLSNATTNTDFRIIYFAAGGSTYQLRVSRGKHGVGVQQGEYTIGDITGTWLHLCLTYDSSTLKGFTAPQLGTHTERISLSASGDGTAGNAWDGLTINGWSGADSSSYQAPSQLEGGLIDDVRIYNTVLTAGQMDADFETELAGNESGLVAYYKFNNNWNDTTANAYNLTAVNSPTFSTTVPFSGAAAATAILNDDDIITLMLGQ